MNATLRLLAVALCSAAPLVAEPPATSRILLLDNENLLEGEVTRVEEGYKVRRSIGGDITVPANRVLAVVADRPAAFALVSERANRRDADERLRLARWCEANGLHAEALNEARTAVKMRTGFVAAERYVQVLELAAAQPKAPIVRVSAEAPAKETVTDVAAIDYNSESFPLFSTKVNAILQNACAGCHAKETVKGFRLTRAGGRSALTKNLMAALAQLDPKDPAKSAILTKAITPHGTGTEAPFKTRTHPAYQTLETWARFARSTEGTATPEAPLPEPMKLPDLDEKKPAGENKGKSATPKVDPFDPTIFNQTGKKKE